MSPSTAHRLLAVLRYRGFAVQDPTRVYLPGPSLSAEALSFSVAELLFMSIAEPHLHGLRDQLQETVNLMVRVGTSVRFLLTLEPRKVLRVGDRQGTILPARLVSGGKVLLAALDVEAVRKLLQKRDDPWGLADTEPELDRLIAELQHVRRMGYALNVSETDEGVGAIGMLVTDDGGIPLGAVSVSAPKSRFDPLVTSESVAAMRATCLAIEGEVSLLGKRAETLKRAHGEWGGLG